jgi:hypothetical protein
MWEMSGHEVAQILAGHNHLCLRGINRRVLLSELAAGLRDAKKVGSRFSVSVVAKIHIIGLLEITGDVGNRLVLHGEVIDAVPELYAVLLV